MTKSKLERNHIYNKKVAKKFFLYKLKQKKAKTLKINFTTLYVSFVIYTIVEAIIFLEQLKPLFKASPRQQTKNSARSKTLRRCSKDIIRSAIYSKINITN